MKHSYPVVLMLIVVAGPVCGQVPDPDLFYVVPVAAFNQQGYDGNVWSTELHAVNLGSEPSELEIVEFIPGSMVPLDTFAECDEPRWTLDPDQELGAPAGLQQCAQSFVGALIIRVGPWISVRSRMVNHGSTIDPWHPTKRPLRGFGQEIPLWRLPEEHGLTSDHLLWPMTWHRNRCSQARAFDSYVGVVNSGDVPGVMRIGDEGDNAAVVVDGVEVPFGAAIDVPAHSWGQYRLQPYDDPFSDCRDARTVTVRVRTEGPLMTYGSVVDRISQDPRTVLPVRRPSGATHP